ncbi:MAG: hypothetical protein BRD29_00215 [Bacteroidetes bacterium QH_2_67_10]|nr:MAG: hypothetical protein BRD29_00215 [Bacteroidetes bacterium QH_2_67_10]
MVRATCRASSQRGPPFRDADVADLYSRSRATRVLPGATGARDGDAVHAEPGSRLLGIPFAPLAGWSPGAGRATTHSGSPKPSPRHVSNFEKRPLGAILTGDGTQFRVWAPVADDVTLVLDGSEGDDARSERLDMEPAGAGYSTGRPPTGAGWPRKTSSFTNCTWAPSRRRAPSTPRARNWAF